MRSISVKTIDGIAVAPFTQVATSFTARLIGLLNRSELGRREGLLLSPGASIHTMGMRFAIDAVFLDRDMRILMVVSNIAPWRAVPAPARTRHVLELSAGRAHAVKLQCGQQLITTSVMDREAID